MQIRYYRGVRKKKHFINGQQVYSAIILSRKRGKGYGKAMLRTGLKFAFEIYGAKKVSLGVFENNLPAYYCYKAAGFSDVVPDTTEKYCIFGEEWKCKELIMEYEKYIDQG